MSKIKKIQTIKDVPILDIVGSFVQLKQAGCNYIGKCPFHDENTPSFYLHPAKGIFKCFGCAAGGDAIEFVQLYKRVSFLEAVTIVAKIGNINIDYEDSAIVSKTTKATSDRVVNKLFDINKINKRKINKRTYISNLLRIETDSTLFEDLVK